jgi:hypothetical protein
VKSGSHEAVGIAVGVSPRSGGTLAWEELIETL